MASVKLLPKDLIDKLRAGEVVERPASALKELIENSLDAGAGEIRVEVRQGGKKLISVMDNGDGMEGEDALLALSRHATSKIASAEDLWNIKTLGFRGEALPSIAAVSRLTLVTAPRGKNEGILIECEGGEIKEKRPSPALGTRIEARELFFNTPARKKFLKSDHTENLHIISVLTKEALSHPATGFLLTADGTQAVNLPPAQDERERILSLYGAEFLEGLLGINDSRPGLTVRGFVSRDGNLRGSKSHQFLFLNGRPIRDPGLSHAVYNAVQGPSGKHPIFFIFLEIDTSHFDINVHPQKEEVRWKEKDLIYRFVYGSIRAANRAPEEARLNPPSEIPLASADSFQGIAPGQYRFLEDISSLMEPQSIRESLPLEYNTSPETVEFQTRRFLKLGEMFYAYREGEGMIILDQHAAHERVLFEKLLNGIRMSARALLFPAQVALPPREYQALLRGRDLLLELGVELEDFGGGSVILRALPPELSQADHKGLLLDVAAGLMEGDPLSGLKENIAARLACHSSVRGSQHLTDQELERLLQNLSLCQDPEHCPHGRPTRIHIDLEQMKRMFRRK